MTPEGLTALKQQLPTAPLSQLADLVRRDWKNVSPYALPYLKAMLTLPSIDTAYYNDSGKSVVLYFLSNAAGWRGDVAKLVKAELKRRAGV